LSKRGQTFTVDFIASLLVFIAILLTVNALWAHILSDSEYARQRGESAALTAAIADGLVRSPGSPEDWTASDVESAGFVGSEALVLDARKLSEFLNADYETQRAALSTGGYGFRLEFWNADGPEYSGVLREPIAYYSYAEEDLLPLLDSSTLEWDYYWGGEGVFVEPAHSSEGFFYAGGQIAALNVLLANQSNYTTIIIEAAALSDEGRAALDLESLRDFVETGGTLVYVGDGDAAAPVIEEGFAAEFEFNGEGRAGEATRSLLLSNATEGEAVSMPDFGWAAAAEGIDAAVFDSENPGYALAGSWEYGVGRIYYVADYDADFAANGTFNIVGAPLEYGFEPSGAGDVFVVNRQCAIEADGVRRWAALTLVLWEARR